MFLLLLTIYMYICVCVCVCIPAEPDQLFYLVYERVKVSSASMGPHLWTYRQRVSLEHLGLTLQENKVKVEYPLLHEFLHVVRL